jgi:hypothetical protein
MWENVIKKDAKRDADSFNDEDFNEVTGDRFDYIIGEIRRLYYPHYNEDNKEKFDMLRIRTVRFINQFNYRKTIRGLKGIKKMVNQFKLPELDYLIEMLEHKMERNPNY